MGDLEGPAVLVRRSVVTLLARLRIFSQVIKMLTVGDPHFVND